MFNSESQVHLISYQTCTKIGGPTYFPIEIKKNGGKLASRKTINMSSQSFETTKSVIFFCLLKIKSNMTDSKSLSIIQHDIYHSLQGMISVVTIISSMFLVNRLENCKPVDNAHENLLKTIHAFCWIGLVIIFIKAFIAGTQYTSGVLVDHSGKVMTGLRFALHGVVVIIAIMFLVYLSHTNINKCSNIQNNMNQKAIDDFSPNNMNSLVSWVVILSILVLVCATKHLVWMIGSLDQVKKMLPNANPKSRSPALSVGSRSSAKRYQNQ